MTVSALPRFMLLAALGSPLGLAAQTQPTARSQRVVIEHESWRLVGDLVLPAATVRVPVVLLLNQAAGDRSPYADLAQRLATRSIGSLRLDLRGHGESTNLGVFRPGELPRDPLIWDADSDVVAAYRYLAALDAADPSRIGVVGASYSGEEAAEVGRRHGPAAFYVLVSPGSLSAASIASMESSGVPWLFVSATEDPFLTDITAAVREGAPSTELMILPGGGHGTDLLHEHGSLAERIAEWIARQAG